MSADATPPPRFESFPDWKPGDTVELPENWKGRYRDNENLRQKPWMSVVDRMRDNRNKLVELHNRYTLLKKSIVPNIPKNKWVTAAKEIEVTKKTLLSKYDSLLIELKNTNDDDAEMAILNEQEQALVEIENVFAKYERMAGIRREPEAKEEEPEEEPKPETEPKKSPDPPKEKGENEEKIKPKEKSEKSADAPKEGASKALKKEPTESVEKKPDESETKSPATKDEKKAAETQELDKQEKIDEELRKFFPGAKVENGVVDLSGDVTMEMPKDGNIIFPEGLKVIKGDLEIGDNHSTLIFPSTLKTIKGNLDIGYRKMPGTPSVPFEMEITGDLRFDNRWNVWPQKDRLDKFLDHIKDQKVTVGGNVWIHSSIDNRIDLDKYNKNEKYPYSFKEYDEFGK